MAPTVTNPLLPFNMESLLQRGPVVQATPPPTPSVPDEKPMEIEVKDVAREDPLQYPTPPSSGEEQELLEGPFGLHLLANVAIVTEKDVKNEMTPVQVLEAMRQRGTGPYVFSEEEIAKREKKPTKPYIRNEHTRPYGEFVDIDDIPDEEQVRRIKLVEQTARVQEQQDENIENQPPV